MPSWNMAQLKSALEKGDVHRFYALHGEETYLLDEYQKTLLDVALENGLPDFNLEIFYGSEASAAQIIDSFNMLPMLSKRRVVLIRNAHEMSAKTTESLISLLDTDVDSSVLILAAPKLDLRLKFFKRFAEIGTMVKFERPFENQMAAWIRYIAEKHGKTLSVEAVEDLRQMVGASLMDMDNEIRKIANYVGERKNVEREDVAASGSRIRVNSVFALAEAIGQNDRAAALCCLANLLDHGESPVGIVSLVSRHVRILRAAKDGIREGLSASQISSRVGVPGTFVREYLDQAKVWSENKLDSTHMMLYETDKALKSSPAPAHIWLENFVIRTCS